MALRRFLRGLVLVLMPLLVLVGCREPEDAGDSGGSVLYVFDAKTGVILAWEDVDALVADGTTAPSRRISGSLLTNNKELGWGGMCIDASSNRLLAVSETGTVVRIERVSRQSGELSSPNDIVSFTLDAASRLDGSVFGQAAVDPRDGTLYVTETGNSSSRVWVVASPGSIPLGGTVPLRALAQSGDKGGTGVAVNQGAVYAYFGGGGSVLTPTSESLAGSRLRAGTSSAFSTVVLGRSTTLGDAGSDGCLALDVGNSLLYVARKNPDLSNTDSPVVAFDLGVFNRQYNQAPSFNVGNLSDHGNLRLITHGGKTNWLLGADEVGGEALGNIWIWKAPRTGGAPVTLNLGDAQIRGLVLYGGN